MSKEVVKSVEKMTLEEFFKSKRRMAIHCQTKEQSKILLKAFDKMGKTWHGGDSYLKEDNWETYKEETCYSNEGFYGFKDFYLENKNKVVEFEKIELEPKKILTAKEITKWILENCVKENGMVNLQGLDFGDKNVDISFLKTTGNLHQSFQKVGGNLYQSRQVAKNLYQDYQKVNENLYQSFQEVGGKLYQGGQKVSGDLIQGNQKVNGDLIQDFQKVNGDLIQSNQIVSGNLYSHKLEKNEVWENGALYVVRKKVLKPITRKELAEMGFEIKD